MAIDGRDSPSRPGRKAHNCCLSGGTDGGSPAGPQRSEGRAQRVDAPAGPLLRRADHAGPTITLKTYPHLFEESHKRLLTFIDHYSRVGKGLETVLNAYNQSVGSFDRSIVPQGRRFAELVVGSETDFNTPAPIDELPRRSAYAAAEAAAEN